MISSSRFSLPSATAFLLASLLGAACGSTKSEPEPSRQEATAPAANPLSEAHQADNRATEKVESDRNARQETADDKAYAAYQISTKERLAKVDAELVKVKASKNAPGLRVRRDELATKLGQMPSSVDGTWVSYTRDVDSKFEGIERDLRAAAL